MIVYDVGHFGVGFLCRLTGSIFPKAMWWAIPATVVSAGVFELKVFLEYNDEEASGSSIMTAVNSFIAILGFMVVFRSNQAWTRYWEGGDLLLEARGSWVSATSSLIAFCSRKPEKAIAVRDFRHKVARMMSLLFSTSLKTLSDVEFETLDLSGLDPEALLRIGRSSKEEVNIEMIIYWIQRTIVANVDLGVLDVAPPILSRVFNELADGMVRISSTRKIRILQFPFHYAQMLGCMLLVYTIGAPLACAYVMQTVYSAAGSAFLNVFVLWCINYLAQELEQPLGKRPNDLPLTTFMNGMNSILVMLLQECEEVPPEFDYDQSRPLKRMRESQVWADINMNDGGFKGFKRSITGRFGIHGFASARNSFSLGRGRGSGRADSVSSVGSKPSRPGTAADSSHKAQEAHLDELDKKLQKRQEDLQSLIALQDQQLQRQQEQLEAFRQVQPLYHLQSHRPVTRRDGHGSPQRSVHTPLASAALSPHSPRGDDHPAGPPQPSPPCLDLPGVPLHELLSASKGLRCAAMPNPPRKQDASRWL
mmetsp:Transcript_20970/g.60570  ORF Transcript_20970/g.60570 Transcript_20970/m.60570 type:complete len:535 (-) Transcript_20970:215-1819(-)